MRSTWKSFAQGSILLGSLLYFLLFFFSLELCSVNLYLFIGPANGIFTKLYCFKIITDISQPTEHRWSPPLYWTDISYLPFIPPSFRRFLLEEGFYLLSLWFGAKCYRVQNKNDAHYLFVAHVVQWLVCSTWRLDGSGSILDLDLFFFLFFFFFFSFFLLF